MIAPANSKSPAPRWNPHFVLQTHLLARQGKTNREIAAALGVTEELFEAWLVVKGTLSEALELGRGDTLEGRFEEINITPLQQQYLIAYARTGTHYGAHRVTGISRPRHYYWLQNEPDYPRAFEMACQEYADRLKQSAIRQATGHYRKYKFNKDGSPVMIECGPDHPEAREYAVREPGSEELRTVYMRHYYEQHFSPGLLVKLLQAASPEEFAERRQTDVHVTGDLSVEVTELIERPKVVGERDLDAAIEGMVVRRQIPAPGNEGGNGDADQD